MECEKLTILAVVAAFSPIHNAQKLRTGTKMEAMSARLLFGAKVS